MEQRARSIIWKDIQSIMVDMTVALQMRDQKRLADCQLRKLIDLAKETEDIAIYDEARTMINDFLYRKYLIIGGPPSDEDYVLLMEMDTKNMREV